jgi:hypothetical protein
MRFPRMKDAATATGLSRWLWWRAERRLPIGTKSQRVLEAEFKLPWRLLMRPWLDEVTSK